MGGENQDQKRGKDTLQKKQGNYRETQKTGMAEKHRGIKITQPTDTGNKSDKANRQKSKNSIFRIM